MQNKTHLKWMKQFVGEEVPLFSIIVFSERCELKKVTVYSEDVKVIKRDRTYATVRDIWDKSPDAISDNKIDELYGKLKELTHVDEAVKAAHIENIEKKYKKDDISVSFAKEEKTVETQIEETNDELLCPKCGSKLILRTAKKGDNAGNKFYGCSSFPKCRYIKNL